MSDEKRLVKYVRNTDPRAGTGEIGPLDGRPNIPIGGVGELTTKEENNLSSFVVLEPVEEGSDEAKAYYDANPPERSLDDYSEQELKDVAEAESIDLSGARTNAAKVERIREARNAAAGGDEEGRESLPATATPSASVPPLAGGVGTAAGPGGAAASGGEGGGPSAAPGTAGGTP